MSEKCPCSLPYPEKMYENCQFFRQFPVPAAAEKPELADEKIDNFRTFSPETEEKMDIFLTFDGKTFEIKDEVEEFDDERGRDASR